jgi:hypothetical protein
MCLTDHDIAVQMLLSNKGIGASEVCAPTTAASFSSDNWQVKTDL